MRRADGHVDDADFVLDLPHHHAELAPMRREPMQHARRRTHRIRAVKFHARRRAAHCERLVAVEHGEALAGVGQRERERLEMVRGVVVAGTGDVHIVGNHGVALLLELARENVFENLEIDAEHLQRGAERDGVLRNRVLTRAHQISHRQRAELHALGRRARHDLVAVI